MRTKLTLVAFVVVLLGSQASPVGNARIELPPDVDHSVTTALKADEWQRAMTLGRRPIEPSKPHEFGSFVVPTRTVSSTNELLGALAGAQPGDVIWLEAGEYRGPFHISEDGTSDQPVTLVGSRQAVITNQSLGDGAALTIEADNWALIGFGLTSASRGIDVRNADDVVLSGLELHEIGGEAVVLSNSTAKATYNYIHDTGLGSPGGGHGFVIDGVGSVDVDIHSNLIGPMADGYGVLVDAPMTSVSVADNSFVRTAQLGPGAWVDVVAGDVAVSDNRGTVTLTPTPDTGHVFARGAADMHDNTTHWTPNRIESPISTGVRLGERPTFVLQKRVMPYTVGELVARHRDAWEIATDGTLTSHASWFAAPGSVLRLRGPELSTLRMASDSDGYSSFVGYGAEFSVSGSDEKRLTLESWDPNAGVPDRELIDGRSYVLIVDGLMDVAAVEFRNLGFEEGTVSGVAWKGVDSPAGGDVTDSVFRGNYFGAYTFEALNMNWTENQFVDNHVYGFDPHDFSNGFLVESNLATGNGSHGIIFSRGCVGNIIRDNVSIGNHGHGIMIDDGKHIPGSSNPRYQQPVPSDHNVIEGNYLADNLDGIVIEGGVGNIVRENEVDGSHRYGIRLKDSVIGTQVTANNVASSQRAGLFVYNGSHGNEITNNIFGASPMGAVFESSNRNVLRDNEFGPLSRTAVKLQASQASTISSNKFTGGGANHLELAGVAVGTVDNLNLANDFDEWRFPAPLGVQTLGASVWLLTLVVPLLLAALGRAHYDLVGHRGPRGRHLRVNPFLTRTSTRIELRESARSPQRRRRGTLRQVLQTTFSRF